MKCKLNFPAACFDCPYDECRATNLPNKQEMTIIRWHLPEEYHDEVRNERSIKARNNAYNRKRRALKRSREWNRLHYQEMKEKRRAYFREYARSHKKVKEG